MPILKRKVEDSFCVIPNALAQDSSLSLRDRGLLLLMLSLPDEWHFSIKGLAALDKKDGVAAIQTSIKSIKAAGYLKIENCRDKGLFRECAWYVSNMPEFLTENSTVSRFTAYGESVFGLTECGESLPNKVTNTEKKQQNKSSGKQPYTRFVPPTPEEVESYCREQRLAVDPMEFCDFYQAKGWMIGKSPMKDWHAAARSWARRNNDKSTNQQHNQSSAEEYEPIVKDGRTRFVKKTNPEPTQKGA